MKKYLTLLFALVLMAGTSCKTEPEPTTITESDPEADREALVKLASEDWDANALAGNMEANVDFYTEDAVNGRKTAPGKFSRSAMTVISSSWRITEISFP